MSITRKKILALGSKLAPAAMTFGRLRALLLDAGTDMEEIVNLIRLDPALTFHVVRLSNSVLFGQREHTDTLEGAVGRVGCLDIVRLVGLAASHQFCQEDLETYRLRADRLWENAVATAAAAEVMALPAGQDAGLAYTAGLLRTLGRAILDSEAAGVVYPGEAEWPLVDQWEREVFGISANEVTAILLDHWRFPAEVVDAIRGHFDPFADASSNVSACVLNLACGVTARFGLDLPGETLRWDVSPAKLTMVGVSEDDLEVCATRARDHYAALCVSVK